MSNPIVIDISHHQPDPIDWADLKTYGTVGVIHKATEGTSYVDDCLFSRAQSALAAGLCWSTYHFLRPGDMAAQMQHYLTTINPRPGERVCLDHEDAGVSLSDLRQAVAICLGHSANLQVTIYSGHLIEEQLGGERDDYLAENTSLWTAQYTDRASEVEWNNATWPVPALWQYSDQCDVIGINGPVDGNKWNGSKENLIAWFGPAGEEPAPAPEPAPDVAHVDVAITATPNALVSVTVNGQVILAAALKGS